MTRRFSPALLRPFERATLTLGMVLLLAGAYDGLCIAPPDRMMGNVYRILYVHVPAAWLSLVAYTMTLVFSVAYLWRPDLRHDDKAYASAELGLMFNGLLVLTGSMWARPTWGVFWSWDPRLTSAAIMFFAFAGYLALRQFVASPERRAVWSSAIAILAFVDIPITYMSVRWWNSLHQTQSSPETVAAPMVLAMRLNAFAFLFLYLGLWSMRARIAEHTRRLEDTEPPEVAPC